jgi:hypothetical protein
MAINCRKTPAASWGRFIFTRHAPNSRRASVWEAIAALARLKCCTAPAQSDCFHARAPSMACAVGSPGRNESRRCSSAGASGLPCRYAISAASRLRNVVGRDLHRGLSAASAGALRRPVSANPSRTRFDPRRGAERGTSQIQSFLKMLRAQGGRNGANRLFCVCRVGEWWRGQQQN